MKKIILLLFIVFYSNCYPQGWFSQYNSQTSDIQDLFFIDANTGWAVGWSGTVLKTINGGSNWINYNISPVYQLTSVRFTNDRNGFAGGFEYTGKVFIPYLFRTTDGGITWNISFQLGDTIGGVLTSISFINENTGFFGLDYFGAPHIYRTTNTGDNWILLNTNLSNGFSSGDIYFTSSGTGYISSYKVINQNNPIINIIIKSTNAGDTWFELHKDTVPYSNSNINRKVFFPNDSIGYLQRGDLYKTTNGGLNFISKATGLINSYCFPDKDTGWCTGYDGKIIKTFNGGNTWVSQNISSNTDLFPVFFVNSKKGWAGGYIRNGGGALIISTNTGGINSVSFSSEDLEDYELFQNYPNPFNPVTVIRYSLIENRFTSLKVYDVLGNEVATLVNERQNSGSYSVEWNGANYSSGIYFYKLTAGDFSDVKKMTLLK